VIAIGTREPLARQRRLNRKKSEALMKFTWFNLMPAHLPDDFRRRTARCLGRINSRLSTHQGHEVYNTYLIPQ